MLLNCSFRPQRTSSHKSLVGSISFMEEYLSLIPPYKVGLGLEFRHTPDMDVPPMQWNRHCTNQEQTQQPAWHQHKEPEQTGCPGLAPPNRWEELAGLHTQPRGAHAALSATSVSSISHFFLGPGNSTCFATSADKCTLQTHSLQLLYKGPEQPLHTQLIPVLISQTRKKKQPKP